MHPFLAPTTGATSGSFTIPTTGETAANVWYRIHLTVAIPAGSRTTSARHPAAQRATHAGHNPAGLQLRLDGQPVATPLIVRQRGRHRAQHRGGDAATARRDHLRLRVVVRWGAGSHNISTPAANTTYTATFGATGTGLNAEYFDNINLTNRLITGSTPP